MNYHYYNTVCPQCHDTFQWLYLQKVYKVQKWDEQKKKRHLTSSYTLTWRSGFILIHVQFTFFCFKCEFVNLFTVIVCCNMAPWIKTQMGMVRWARLQSLPPTSSSPTFRKFIIYKLTTKLLGVSPIIMKNKMFAFSL